MCLMASWWCGHRRRRRRRRHRRQGKEGKKTFSFSPAATPPHAKPHFAWRNFYCFPPVSFSFSASAPFLFCSINLHDGRAAVRLLRRLLHMQRGGGHNNPKGKVREAKKRKRACHAVTKCLLTGEENMFIVPYLQLGKPCTVQIITAANAKTWLLCNFAAFFSSSKCVCSEPARKWTSARTYYSLSPSMAPTI